MNLERSQRKKNLFYRAKRVRTTVGFSLEVMQAE